MPFRHIIFKDRLAYANLLRGVKMSVVIVGGNECMVRQYKEICSEYKCKAKIYPKMASGLKNIGAPDLLVLFTNTVSHKMVRCALSEAKRRCISVVPEVLMQTKSI